MLHTTSIHAKYDYSMAITYYLNAIAFAIIINTHRRYRTVATKQDRQLVSVQIINSLQLGCQSNPSSLLDYSS